MRRGPLLWPVIHSVQGAPAPSSSSTSRPLTPIESESVYSQSPSPTPVVESLQCTSENSSKKSYDTWTKEEQKLLVQLWAEHFERLESKDARKIWQMICDEINNRLGCHKTAQKCTKKMKYLIDRYKEAKDWNTKQTGGNLRKTIFYDEIDEVLGCRDAVTMKRVVHAGAVGGKDKQSTDTSTDVQGNSESGEQERQPDQRKRSDRKKSKKRQRLEDQEDEEQGFFKHMMVDMKEQRQDMKDFMSSFQQMQNQQMQTMNTFLGAMTQFLQSSSTNNNKSNKE